MIGRVMCIIFFVFVIGTSAQSDSGTGARLLISQKLIHFVTEALGPSLLGAFNFTLPDYTYNNETVNYSLTDIVVVPGQGVQINTTLLTGAIELDLTGCEATIYWTLNWNITGKDSTHGSLSASTAYMFDLSIISGVNVSNGIPVIYFTKFEISDITYIAQNYSTLPPQIQNAPYIVLTKLLNNDFGASILSQITTVISNLDPGYISLIDGIFPIAISTFITEPPVFTPDTFSVGLSIDVRYKNALLLPSPCTLPHVLPVQNRTYDFELHLGNVAASCLLLDLKTYQQQLSQLISLVYFQGLMAMAFQLPDDLPVLNYAPAINTTHLDIQFSPSIDVWFGTSEQVEDVHFHGGASTGASIDLVLFTNGSTSYVEVQATADVTQLHGDVQNATNIPEIYSNQINGEHWGDIQKKINGLLAPFLPYTFNISPQQLQLLPVLFDDISFDAYGNWLNIRAAMKSF